MLQLHFTHSLSRKVFSLVSNIRQALMLCKKKDLFLCRCYMIVLCMNDRESIVCTREGWTRWPEVLSALASIGVHTNRNYILGVKHWLLHGNETACTENVDEFIWTSLLKEWIENILCYTHISPAYHYILFLVCLLPTNFLKWQHSGILRYFSMTMVKKKATLAFTKCRNHTKCWIILLSYNQVKTQKGFYTSTSR